MLAAALALLPCGPSRAAETPGGRGTRPRKSSIIPIRSEIDKPALYILRRGLKEAIEHEVDTSSSTWKRPAARLDVTFDILKALEKFPGKTVTYVNREAISAGALISAGTDEIWFAPGRRDRRRGSRALDRRGHR